MEQRRVPVAEGVEVAVDVWPAGSGAGVVLVHGLASNARLWDGVAAELQARGHPVATLDQRGHGRSAKPATGYGFAEVVSDLARVLDALGWDRPVVAGQSWGGNVVLELAARHPEAVRGIVGVDGGFLELGARFPDWESCREALAPPDIEGLEFDTIAAMVRAHHPDWPEAGIAGVLACFERRPDGTVAPWLARAAHLEILRHLWEHVPSARYAALEVPALLLVADDAGEPEWTERKQRDLAAVEAAAPPGRLRAVWIEGDHDLHAQHPARVAELIHDAAENEFG